MPTVTTVMTADDLMALPDDGFQYELVRGEPRRMPPPNFAHGVRVGRVARPLLNYADDTGRAFVATNDARWRRERDPDTVRGPDIAVMRADRVPPTAW